MAETSHTTGGDLCPDDSLSAAQIADGRSRLYAILARLVAQPASSDLVAHLAAWPDLAEQTPPPAAQHQWLLEFQLHPYAGVFMHPRGLLGDPLHHNLGSFYASAGHQPRLHTGGPDHLANLLDGLAHLCGAASDAWRDQLPQVARQIELFQSTLMTHYLLPWLPPFAVSLRQLDSSFYRAWLDLLLTALENHLQFLPQAPAPVADNTEPAPPDLEESDTRALAAWFTIPRRAGLYLTPAELQAWGKQMQVAPGFGARARQLETVFQTVPQAEWPLLLSTIAAWLQTGQAEYVRLHQEFPALSPFISPWQQRLQTTQSMLHDMETMLNRA